MCKPILVFHFDFDQAEQYTSAQPGSILYQSKYIKLSLWLRVFLDLCVVKLSLFLFYFPLSKPKIIRNPAHFYISLLSVSISDTQ